MTTIKHLTLFLLLHFLTAFSFYGQDRTAETPTTDFKRVQIGINISPDFCYRTLKNNDGSWFSASEIDRRNKRDTVKLGFTSGLNVCFNIKKFVSLETGIQYSNKGYQTKVQNLHYMPPDRFASKKYIYDFHCIDIPVKVNFTLGQKKVRFFTSVGLTTNIFIKDKSNVLWIYSDETVRKTNPTNFAYNKVNISPTISFGIDCKINGRMNLRVEPTFRYCILKIIDSPLDTYKDYSLANYLYSGGLNISYYFGL